MPDVRPGQSEPRRTRKTRASVHVADRLSAAVISIGGLAVILAVLGIFVYLIGVTAALFRSGETSDRLVASGPAAQGALFVQPDEHASSYFLFDRDGVLTHVELSTGAVASSTKITPEGRRITAFFRAPREGVVAIGYDDGSVQLGRIHYDYEFLFDPEIAARLSAVPINGSVVDQGGVVQRTVLGQLRKVKPVVDLPAPVRPGDGDSSSPIRAIGYYAGISSEYAVVVREDGSAILSEVRKIVPLGGGPPRVRLSSYVMPFTPPAGAGMPDWLFVTGDGGSLVAAWRGGAFQRYDISKPADVVLVESGRLVDEGRTVAAAAFLLGSRTLMVSDDRGAVGGWFKARDAATSNRDKQRFVRAHEFEGAGAAVTGLTASERTRLFTSVDSSGEIVVRYMTSNKRVASVDAADLNPVVHAVVMPKTDGILAVGESGRYRVWNLAPAHPEATWRSLFGKVWYEGEPAPAFVYQSSSGDDAAEPKYGLTPLILGTLKATVYTLIFAVPVAVFAALCTSEFLTRRSRNTIKPMIEMMASLPSVVLGFVAALIVSPFINDHLPSVLAAFLTIPLGVLLGAHLWQMVPVHIVLGWPSAVRGVAIVVIMAGSVFSAFAVGPWAERLLFSPSTDDVLVLSGSVTPVERSAWPAWIGAREVLDESQIRQLRREGFYWRDGAVVLPSGDVRSAAVQEEVRRYGFDRADLRQWLNGAYGTAWPGWFVIAMPGAIIVIFLTLGRAFDTWARSLDLGGTQVGAAATELVKFISIVAGSATLAAGAAGVLTTLGLDPRDSIFGTFQQRNTLVICICMSVAVIPIIYTICEDSLSSVPDTLRSASLASGATRWQTATRVVVPVAMSGIFSAVMIGLGRAAGETMIVLMATGNTPIMSWSIFDGMRTLSANIAVELPEAPKDETHYRVLFLCGLVLFVITFAFNTLAEIVRQRYRKRSAQL